MSPALGGPAQALLVAEAFRGVGSASVEAGRLSRTLSANLVWALSTRSSRAALADTTALGEAPSGTGTAGTDGSSALDDLVGARHGGDGALLGLLDGVDDLIAEGLGEFGIGGQ